MKRISVDELYQRKRERLGLELLTDESTLKRTVTDANVSSPGLLLAGYTERVAEGRIYVMGETEISYLNSLGAEALRDRLRTFFSFDVSAVFVAKEQRVPPLLVDLAREHDVALFTSPLKTFELYRRLQPYLEERFAPTITLHGSLADVYGVGLMFVGRSGIGKSECVLDLVERGHRLVADDLVHVTRRGNDVLIGRGHELQRHHMEIRGIGIIDIPALFGIRSIRQQKRIEVVVQLEEWSEGGQYERTGLEGQEIDVLGVKLPKITVPLNPGKNITVISEVVAMDHLLKYSGIHSAATFDRRLQEAMHPVREYLEEDYE